MEEVQKISNLISPGCNGIIWITEGKIDLSHPYIYELNYLLDGLLLKRLAEDNNSEDHNHFFLSESFGEPFFIGHIDSKENLLKIISSHLDISMPYLENGGLVYLLNQSSGNKNLIKELQKKYKNIDFKDL